MYVALDSIVTMSAAWVVALVVELLVELIKKTDGRFPTASYIIHTFINGINSNRLGSPEDSLKGKTLEIPGSRPFLFLLLFTFPSSHKFPSCIVLPFKEGKYGRRESLKTASEGTVHLQAQSPSSYQALIGR